MRVEELDHLGLIAGIIDQMGLEERVNECLGTHPQQIVSPGQGVKAMILNGLGFVSAPLYLYEGFFADKATEHLLGEGIEAKHLNDDYLGRLLDKIWEYGASELFSRLAMDAYGRFELELSRYHLDSSSFSVHGAYESEATQEGSIEITYGHSKAHRPDLKQFLIELICSNDGDVPVAFEASSGNQSDQAVFGKRLKAFAEQWDVEGLLVSDSALYNQENLRQLGGLHWLTRVPLSVGQAQKLVTTLPPESFTPSLVYPNYHCCSVCSTYGDIKQHWVVFENQARIESDRKQVDKRVKKQGEEVAKQLRRHMKVDFNCPEDARQQTEALAKGWSYHRLGSIEIIEHPHYAQSGRPKKGQAPDSMTYRVTAQVIQDEEAITRAKAKAGRFILATNQLEDAQIKPDVILEHYKGQQAPERSFGFLKDPLFFTSSVFLKTPERIGALGMIMAVALMVYTLAQRQLRQSLAQAQATLPDQRKRPTQTPTLRWIFQCFQAVHLVWIEGKARVSNLTPERLKILRFFGAPCQKYYLLS